MRQSSAQLNCLSIAILLALMPIQELLAGPGLPTRDMNPILQTIFLPGYLSLDEKQGWRIDHALYITNTTHSKANNSESVVIDGENYRYELMLGYRQNDWVWQLRLPHISHVGGHLDSAIESWHDFLDLPDGPRASFPKDQLQIRYRRNNNTVLLQTEPSHGFGDVSIAFGHHPPGETGYFVALELPTGSASDHTGNEGIDVAAWLLGDHAITPKLSTYGMLGVTVPADTGALENLVADYIWVAQVGLSYDFSDQTTGYTQLDLHSESLKDSTLEPFDDSLQLQLGLGFDGWLKRYRVDLFISEDIDVGSAPDITFGIRLAQTL